MLSWDLHEIIVCDKGSSDRTGDLALSSGASIVAESKRQIARSRNTAAQQAGGNEKPTNGIKVEYHKTPKCH